jgi:hypothetical protein
MVDRRYGAGNKYGNGRLYGASDTPIVNDRFRWAVDVGWETTYSGENEADYMTALYVFRGRRSFLNPNGQGFAPVETGRARVTLSNHDGRYDGWNTSSPLYPNVQPGKFIRIRLRDLDSGTIYNVFTGIVLDIETIGYGADAKVVLVCEDGWYYLRNSITRAGVVREDFSVPRILGMIFGNEYNQMKDPFHYPFGTEFEESLDVVPYWWSSNDILIGDMVHDLAQSFFGKFFIAADGTAKYYDSISTRTSVQTYDQSQMLKDIGNFQPWKNQRNVLRIKVRPRAEAANQIVWSLSSPVQVLKGETLSLSSIFTYNSIQVPVLTPGSNAITDYNMNTASDGSGTALTTSFYFFAIPLGDTIEMLLINNSSSDGYVTDFDWVGIPVYETGSSDITYPNVKPSQVRELLIDSLWHEDLTLAIEFVNNYGPQIAAVRQFPIIQFDTRPEALVPDLFDIVTVGIAELGISNTEFEVGGIEVQTLNETCQSFLVKQFLEPHLIRTITTFYADYLVLGGGGGGSSGGGGAGQLLTGTDTLLLGESYGVVIGAGGAGHIVDGTAANGANGDDSTFNNHTALGGGGGANSVQNGSDGGNGGGAGSANSTKTGGTGDHNGGSNGAFTASPFPAAGGAGTSANGANAAGASTAGAGGAGTANSITGSSVTYGGGGGGAVFSGGTPGAGGAGGGGAGVNSGTGTAGTANLGGGGGGTINAQTGGAGGSGVVIIRYLSTVLDAGTGGTITADGDYTIHTFTSDGTFVAPTLA